MLIIIPALPIGGIADRRAMAAPMALSWAARLGMLDLSGSWRAFLGWVWKPFTRSGPALAGADGALAGAAARAALTARFRQDPPAALIEHMIAPGGAALLLWSLS